MTEEQQTGLATLLDRLGKNLLGLKRAVESSTNATLAVKDAVEKSGKANAEAFDRVIAQNSAVLTEIKLLAKDIAEARADVREVDNNVDDVRRDLTPVRGIPLPPPRNDDSIELGPVKAPVKVWERVLKSLPLIVLGVLLGYALLIAATWASGNRITVEEVPAHRSQTQQGGNP